MTRVTEIDFCTQVYVDIIRSLLGLASMVYSGYRPKIIAPTYALSFVDIAVDQYVCYHKTAAQRAGEKIPKLSEIVSSRSAQFLFSESVVQLMVGFVLIFTRVIGFDMYVASFPAAI